MITIKKNIIGLKSISRLHTSTAILTLILWIASFQYIQEIVMDTNSLYQHPYKVSNASQKFQFHTQSIYRLMNDLKHHIGIDQLKASQSLVNQHESQLLSEYALLSKRYLGNKERIDNIYQLIINWRTIRQDIFKLYFRKTDDVGLKYAEQQSNMHVAELQKEIIAVVNFANNKAKFFTESAKLNINNIEKIGLVFYPFLLSMQLLLFMMFKRNSVKEKNKVLQSLTWSNQLLNSSPDAMIITDEDGKIEQVNISAIELFGYTKDEFIGINISALMPERFNDHHEKIKGFFTRSKSRAMGEGKELFAVKKSGKEIQVEISLNLAELNQKRVAIASIRDVTKQKSIESKVLHQANYDSLTDLPNRFLSLDRLSTSIAHAKRNNNKVAIMYIDLDDFKKANDIYGHQMGDSILVSTARNLKNAMRAEDTVGRLGGDEFFVLIDNFSSPQSLIKVANNILEVFKKPLSIERKSILISASIGISTYPDDGTTAEELLVNADLSMYRSKNTGKNSFTFFENSMKELLRRESSIEEALKDSLERNEFYVVYQPKYDICSNTIIGFEALLRWNNANFKDSGPDEFIPIIEQIGLIHEVGMFVLDSALKEIKKWQSITQRPLQMAVNISPIQFNDPRLLQLIQEKLTKHNLTGHSLEIEITEGVLLEGTSELKTTLRELREANIGIALDDFGTGYSSLSYIKDYPISSIKIDRSFVEEINKNKTHTMLVEGIISLAHSLECHVTAEGIEYEAQLAYLRQLKCDIAQGFYLSRPLTADKVTQLL